MYNFISNFVIIYQRLFLQHFELSLYMESRILAKVLAYAGSISIQRTWREKGKEISRQVKFSDVSNIGTALDDGWVITFPQGTTTPFKPIRRGTAHIIKTFKPIVVLSLIHI